jgi:hypothetical protein
MGSKDDPLRLRAEAVALRRAGKSHREIKTILGIGNSTLGDALAGEPPPALSPSGQAPNLVR